MRRLILVFILSAPCFGQLWSGILAPARATDWSGAGVTGGIPSDTWTQCGPTIAAYSGTAATINNALNHTGAGYTSCPANTYILLGAGTFTLSTGITFGHTSNNELRGSGANSTFIVAATNAPNATCNNGAPFICIDSSDATYWVPGTVYNWTNGFAQGGSSVTLSGTSGISANSTIVILDQCDDGYLPGSGSSCVGASQDNSQYFNCSDAYGPSGTVNTTGTAVTWVSGPAPPGGGGPFNSGWAGATIQINTGAGFVNFVVASVTDSSNLTLTSSAGTHTGVSYIAVLGCSFNGPDNGNERAQRAETELFQVSAVNAGTGVVSLDRPLRNPNWQLSQGTQAWFVQPVQNDGVRNLSLDLSATATPASGITLSSTANCWVKGVRIVNANVTPIWTLLSVHFTYEQNYFYGAQSGDPYGFRQTIVSDGLVQNNIVQQIRVGWLDEGPDNGTVIAYNHFILQKYLSDAMFQSIRPHAGGDNYELIEGNTAVNYYGEDYHGSHGFQTAFRNFFTGWESCGSGASVCGVGISQKDFQTQAFMLDAFNRYVNAVGNVLGTPGYHITYQDTATPVSLKVIYPLGNGNHGVSPQVNSDALVPSTLMRWGNYDTVNNASLFCTGVGVPIGACLGNEKGNGAATYPALASPSSSFPPSFYMASQPSWWGTHVWPPIGPDVTNGNVGACSSSTTSMAGLNNAGQFNGVPASSSSQCTGSHFLVTGSAFVPWAGHVNLTPAMDCALNVMGMPPDGSGSVLPFNPAACYAAAPPPPPAGLQVAINCWSCLAPTNAAVTPILPHIDGATLPMDATSADTTASNCGLSGGLCNPNYTGGVSSWISTNLKNGSTRWADQTCGATLRGVGSSCNSNVVIRHISNGGSNSATPAYVFGHNWADFAAKQTPWTAGAVYPMGYTITATPFDGHFYQMTQSGITNGLCTAGNSQPAFVQGGGSVTESSGSSPACKWTDAGTQAPLLDITFSGGAGAYGGSFPNWVTATSYSAGAIVRCGLVGQSCTNHYFQTASNCTSGANGGNPANWPGSDGGCSWADLNTTLKFTSDTTFGAPNTLADVESGFPAFWETPFHYWYRNFNIAIMGAFPSATYPTVKYLRFGQTLGGEASTTNTSTLEGLSVGPTTDAQLKGAWVTWFAVTSYSNLVAAFNGISPRPSWVLLSSLNMGTGLPHTAGGVDETWATDEVNGIIAANALCIGGPCMGYGTQGLQKGTSGDDTITIQNGPSCTGSSCCSNNWCTARSIASGLNLPIVEIQTCNASDAAQVSANQTHCINGTHPYNLAEVFRLATIQGTTVIEPYGLDLICAFNQAAASGTCGSDGGILSAGYQAAFNNAAVGQPSFTWKLGGGSMGVAFGPPLYLGTQTNTTNIVANQATPNVGGLTGLNTVVTPSDLGNTNRVARLTDSTVDSNGSLIGAASGSADQNVWNTNSTLFYTQDGNAHAFIFQFNPVSMLGTELYGGSIGSNGGTFSRTNPNLFYTLGAASGTSATQILKYDFTNRGGGPPSPTLVFDFGNATCLGVGYNPLWHGVLTISADDSTFMTGYSTTGGQDTGTDEVAYKVGSGCRYLNTATGSVTGDWGVTGTINIVDRGWELHDTIGSKDGQSLITQWNNCIGGNGNCPSAVNGTPYVWNIPGTTVGFCSSGNQCQGHWTEGYDVWFNNSGNASPNFFDWRSLSSMSSPQGITMAKPSSFTADTHSSYNDADPAHLNPIIFSTADDNVSNWLANHAFALNALIRPKTGNVGGYYFQATVGGTSAGSAPTWPQTPGNTVTDGGITWTNEGLVDFTYGWENEVLGLNSTGTTWRFGHTFNSGANLSNFTCTQGIGQVSQDGKFFLFPSDWMGTLGSENGSGSCSPNGTAGTTNCRCDTFVMELK